MHTTEKHRQKYMDEFSGKAVETIKAAGGRFIVRANEVTKLSGDAPNRLVITGWESLDDVKKWQAGESAMRYNSAIVALVTRLKSRGRLKPKQIVVAAMRNLLVLCFGVLKTGRPFDAAIAMGG